MKLLVALATCVACAAVTSGQTAPSSSPDNSPHSMQQDSQPPSLASSLNRGDRKLTGCIRSDKGAYFVDTRTHKRISLSGPEDFAPHLGHTVTLYGSFLNESGSTRASRTDHGAAVEASAGSDFQVSKIEMVSDTCKFKSAKRAKPPSSQP
jgi:hypothetical protein